MLFGCRLIDCCLWFECVCFVHVFFFLLFSSFFCVCVVNCVLFVVCSFLVVQLTLCDVRWSLCDVR